MPNSLSQYLPSTDYCIKEICTYGTIRCPWYWSKAYKQYTIIQNKHFNLKSICICNGYCILLVVYIGKSSIFSFFRETFTCYFLYSAYLIFFCHVHVSMKYSLYIQIFPRHQTGNVFRITAELT